jgi:DNA polymerase-1
VADLGARLLAELDGIGGRALYEEIELPLIRVLAKMEVAGIAVDVARLRGINAELTEEAAKLEARLHGLAGEEFNVNSSTQLRTILYDKLKLTPQRKTKTGYSTDAATLEKLRDAHPIVETLLRYREVEKLRSTYGEGLLAEVAADGRIHASFNQTVARTGRLSSDRPNLHNIPVRTEDGRRIREAFVPAAGTEFLIADYNQIELRVIAHLTGDPGLVEEFAAGHDIHAATASRIYGVEPGDVTTAQRSKAKMVSYGLAYGMEAYGLSQRLGVGLDEAAEILGQYFTAFPAVRAYMERSVAEARARGYTATELGRRRYIPELVSDNHRIRQAAERQAMNAGIQGLAADIFKLALVRLDAALESGGQASRLVLQVHDEVLVEVPESEHDSAEAIVREAMEHAYPLRVPLAVHLSWGNTWAAAK